MTLSNVIFFHFATPIPFPSLRQRAARLVIRDYLAFEREFFGTQPHTYDHNEVHTPNAGYSEISGRKRVSRPHVSLFSRFYECCSLSAVTIELSHFRRHHFSFYQRKKKERPVSFPYRSDQQVHICLSATNNLAYLTLDIAVTLPSKRLTRSVGMFAGETVRCLQFSM